MVIPFRRVERAAAPWVRTRLRSAPAAALALALLVAVTACLAAAFPRALERYEDAGLRRSVEQVPHSRSVVGLSAPVPLPDLPQDQREQALLPATVKRQYASILGTVRRPFVPDPGQSSYGVATSVNQAVPEPWLPRPSGLPARVALVAQAGLADHARLSEGRLPRASGTVTATTPEVEAAVSADTAKSLRIEAGSVLHVPGAGRDALAVRVTGIVAPRDRDGAYWATDTLLRTPALMRVTPADPESPGTGSVPCCCRPRPLPRPGHRGAALPLLAAGPRPEHSAPP